MVIWIYIKIYLNNHKYSISILYLKFLKNIRNDPLCPKYIFLPRWISTCIAFYSVYSINSYSYLEILISCFQFFHHNKFRLGPVPKKFHSQNFQFFLLIPKIYSFPYAWAAPRFFPVTGVLEHCISLFIYFFMKIEKPIVSF